MTLSYARSVNHYSLSPVLLPFNEYGGEASLLRLYANILSSVATKGPDIDHMDPLSTFRKPVLLKDIPPGKLYLLIRSKNSACWGVRW